MVLRSDERAAIARHKRVAGAGAEQQEEDGVLWHAPAGKQAEGGSGPEVLEPMLVMVPEVAAPAVVTRQEWTRTSSQHAGE